MMSTGINQKMNILDLCYKVRSEIEQSLQEKWKDLLAVVTEHDLHFDLRDIEIQEIERACLRADGCSSRKLLDLWGDRGMTVSQLAKYLDHLKLERPLMLIRDPEDLQITKDVKNAVTVDQGRRLQLECTAVGFPYPRYIWFRGKTELRGGYNGVLTIEQVSMEDAGQYICRVHNVLKSYIFSSWCEVTVNKVDYPDQSPRLCIVEQPTPHSITVPIRKCIYLKCRVVPDLAPTYQWLKGDNWLQGQTSSELKIEKATLNDSGQYKCIVRSGSQEVVSDTVNVTVCRRDWENLKIIVHPVDVTTYIDGVIHFRVKAQGKAPLQYAWYHNGKVIPGANSEDLQVNVDSVKLAGTYQCRVSSDQPDCHCMSREAKLEVNRGHIQYRATDKVALLIGISRYRGNSPPLPAVINDIYFTRKKLEELEFKVISLVNLDLGEMQKAISWFCKLLAKGAYGLFYVAGHGFQYQGQHYLVPWDAPEGLKLQDCLCIQEVQTMAQKKKPAVLLVFLDICRKESSTIDQKEQATCYQPGVAGNSCTFFSATFGQESFEPNFQASAIRRQETVIPHQSADTMYTSIFTRYLLPVIGVKQSIPDVFKHLMDAIDASQDYFKHYQNPEMQINLLEHGRSLCDAIDDPDPSALNRRTELWEEMHQLPICQDIDLKYRDQVVHVIIRHEYFFTNVLCMYVIPRRGKLDCVQQFSVDVVDGSVPVAIKPVEKLKRCDGSHDVLVILKNLQKLDRRLKPCLELSVNQRKTLIPKLDLGWPLVSQLQQQEQEARPAPHKEATEQEEDTQDLTSGQSYSLVSGETHMAGGRPTRLDH